MSRERALLRRLDKAEADLRAVGGYENELQYIPAGGVRSLLADLRALLAEPEHPESRCQECGGENPVWYAPNALWNAVMGTQDNPRGEGVIICPNCFTKRIPTPRSRAEAEAMVEKSILQAHATWHMCRLPDGTACDVCREYARAEAAELLAALCGEGM